MTIAVPHLSEGLAVHHEARPCLALLFMPFTWRQTDPMNSTTMQYQKVPSSPTSVV